MKATINGREYEIAPTSVSDTLLNLRDHLIASGFDGEVYEGISKPVGLQRKEYRQMFFRRTKNGNFESVI